ncbi:MAG: molybdopterin-dependent oxidoreductase [Thermoleophilaceae bacterium]|nr:molybdopterin-dependent oxidoreductase [Thermoleophilaceae bacterium]
MTERRARWSALLGGALATAPALALGWVAHRGSPRIPFAPTALADRLIRVTPGEVATAAIDRLQHAAQQLLTGGVVAFFVLAGGVVAVQLRSSARAALAWSMIVFAGGLATPVEHSLQGALMAAAVAGGAYGAALSALRRRPEPRQADPARRQVIVAIGTVTVGALVAADPLSRVIGSVIGKPRRLQTGALPRAAAPARGPFPHVSGLTGELTSAADHYVVDIDINDPVVDGPSWRLRVDGLVDEPLDVGFLELQREFAVVDEISVVTCISNRVGGPLVGCSRWEGPRLADVLRRVRPRADATSLVVRCADGYSAGIPLTTAMHPSAQLAIAQNGQALSREHGFPCRLRLPALYGMLNPKWVTSIELVDRPYRGYWAQQGWSASAVVRTQSRIDTPSRARTGEPTWVAGVAWAGIRGITGVDVSTDGGRSWNRAQLQPPLSRWAWTRWAYRWTPPRPGAYVVVCRATDGTGATQDARRRSPHPAGASGYHRVDVAVTR